MTATLLALTVSTPIWGKLADLLDRKLLVQLALVIFAVGGAAGGQIPDPAMLPVPVRAIVEHAYGLATADIFLVAAPLGLVALIAISMLDEVPLGTSSGADLDREREASERAQPDERVPAPVPAG